MSEKKTLAIVLAGQSFEIDPFTVGQLEELNIGSFEFKDMQDADSVRDYYARHLSIISTALQDKYPSMTVDVLRKMRVGTRQALTDTVMEILIFSGIWKRLSDKQESPPEGEAQAAA